MAGEMYLCNQREGEMYLCNQRAGEMCLCNHTLCIHVLYMYRICPVCFLNINTCAYVVNVLTLTLNTQDKRTDNRFVKNRYNDENDG